MQEAGVAVEGLVAVVEQIPHPLGDAEIRPEALHGQQLLQAPVAVALLGLLPLTEPPAHPTDQQQPWTNAATPSPDQQPQQHRRRQQQHRCPPSPCVVVRPRGRVSLDLPDHGLEGHQRRGQLCLRLPLQQGPGPQVTGPPYLATVAIDLQKADVLARVYAGQ